MIAAAYVDSSRVPGAPSGDQFRLEVEMTSHRIVREYSAAENWATRRCRPGKQGSGPHRHPPHRIDNCLTAQMVHPIAVEDGSAKAVQYRAA